MNDAVSSKREATPHLQRRKLNHFLHGDLLEAGYQQPHQAAAAKARDAENWKPTQSESCSSGFNDDERYFKIESLLPPLINASVGVPDVNGSRLQEPLLR